ncbi:hypothetical protein JF55_05760 [Pseudomonas sp. 1-7]|nr:hypothetical protein JF55_05760 [Pseudomonas sp. 1-7]
MATIFKGYRIRLAYLMSGSDTKADKWFDRATFAKASTGHYMAWRTDDLSRVAVLPPDHPRGEPCRWLASLSEDADIESAVRYIESGEFDEAAEGGMLNLFVTKVTDKATGERLREMEDSWVEL